MLDLLNTFYNVIVPIFLIALLGAILDRFFPLNIKSLSQVVVYLTSPALAFSSLYNANLQAKELGQLTAFTIIVLLILASIGWTVAQLLKLNKKTVSAFALSSTLTNSGNFGLPFVFFAFGEHGLGKAIVVFAAGAIVSNTLGVFLASRGSASIKISLLNVLKVPLSYAVILGILANFKVFTIPLPLEQGITLLGDGAIPLMLIILGARLSRTEIKNQFGVAIIASAIKIIVAPILGVIVAKLLMLSGLAANVAIIQISMPTAVITIILAEEFGSDAGFVSSVVTISTLVSFISLSILLNLLI